MPTVPITRSSARIPEMQQQFRYGEIKQPANRLQGMEVRTNADMFGAAGGRDLEKAGHVLQRSANQFAHLIDDYNNTAAREGASQFQQDFLAWQSEAQKKVGKDGASTGADYDTWAQQRLQELGKDMNTVQRGRFQSLIGERMGLQKRWAEGYGQEQNVVHKTSLYKAEMSNAGNLIATNPNDPEMVAQAIQQIDDASFSYAKLKGLDDKAGIAFMRENLDTHLGGTIHNLIQQGQTGAASRLMKQYGDQLGGMAMGKLNAAMTREREHQEAKARAAQTLRRMEARQLASLAPDQLSYAAQTNDFTAVEKTATQLQSMGATAEAAELLDTINVKRQASTIVQGLNGMSFVEARAETEKAFNAEGSLRSDNAIMVGRTRKEVEHLLDAREAAFVKDPAAFVAQFQPQDPQMSTQERLTRSLEMQQEMAKGTDFKPQLLTKAQRLSFKDQYDAATDGTQRLKMVRDWQQDYGPYFAQLAKEAKLPDAVVSLSPALPNLTAKGGGALLTAATLHWKDLPGGEQETSKKEALATADTSRVVEMFAGLQKSLPFNESVTRQAKDFRDTIGKATLAGMSVSEIDDQYDVVNDSGMHLAIPKDRKVNVESVERVLKFVREDVQQKLEGMSADLPKPVKSNYSLSRLWTGNIRRAAEQGVWVSSPDVEGASLIDPANGKILYTVEYRDVPALNQKIIQMRADDITEGDL